MTTYYVAIDGDDANRGTENRPFRTIQRAADMMVAGDTCLIREGTYRETVRPTNSGTAERPIRFEAYPDETAVVNGTEPVTGWKLLSGHIYKAKVNLDLAAGNQVFVDQEMMEEARWPHNANTLLQPKLATMDRGTTPTSIYDEDMPDLDWTGATVWCCSNRRWTSFSSTVTDYMARTVHFNRTSPDTFNDAREGGVYYLSGKLEALDAEKEWYHDTDENLLYLWAPDGVDPSTRTVEAKKRVYAFNLSNRTHIQISGIHIFAATITTSEATGCILDDLTLRYVWHSTRCEKGYQSQSHTGVIISGKENELRNSEIAYSSGCGVSMDGLRNRLVNCAIHDVDYSGTYACPIRLDGEGHLISHNTASNAGRSIMIGSPRDASIQYNDFYNCGMICRDVGTLHFFHSDGANTEIHHNWVHDNLSDELAAGIYLDNACQNYIVHHNVVFNIPWAAMVLNLPSNYNLIYNNTLYNPKGRESLHGNWGWTFAFDMLGVRIFNNIFASQISLASEATTGTNLFRNADPALIKPEQSDFHLRPDSPAINAGTVIAGINDNYVGSAPDIGAYEHGSEGWIAGHDFLSPPSLTLKALKTSYMNLLSNPAFETGDLAPWKKMEGAQATIIKNTASDNFRSETGDIRTGQWSARLGKGRGGIEQIVTELVPDTAYMFVGWVKVSSAERVQMGVKGYGAEEKYTTYGATRGKWVRLVVVFKTGCDARSAIVYVKKGSRDSGYIYVDDFGLTELQLNQEVYW